MSATTDTARAALQQGDTAQAIALLEQGLSHTPDDYDTSALLGAAYSQASRHDDALRTLTQAVTLQPANPQARFNLGIAYERAGWKDHALAAMQQATTLKPDYTQAHQEAARLQQEIGPPEPFTPAPFQSAPPQTVHTSSYTPPGYGATYPGASSSGLPPHPSQYPQAPHAYPINHASLPASSYSGPKIGPAVAVGLLMGLVIGVLYGWFSLSAGFRIPFAHLLIGWLIGLGVRGAAGEEGDLPGVIAGASTLLSIGVGVGLMYLGGAYFTWFTGIIALIGVYVAFRTAGGGGD
jgi:hypothetical protein